MANVLFPSLISHVTGEKRTTVKAKTSKELIRKLVELYGEPFKKTLFEETGEMNRYIRVYINGRVVEDFMQNNVALNEYSEVAMLVVISGG